MIPGWLGFSNSAFEGAHIRPTIFVVPILSPLQQDRPIFNYPNWGLYKKHQLVISMQKASAERRGISGIYATGIILLILTSSVAFASYLSSTQSTLFDYRERSLKLEVERGLERLEVTTSSIRNLGPVPVTVKYLHKILPNGSAIDEELNLKLDPFSSSSIRLEPNSFVITDRGNVYQVTGEGADPTVAEDAVILPVKDKVFIYESSTGLLKVFNPDLTLNYSMPFVPSSHTVYGANSPNYTYYHPEMLYVSGKSLYTLNYNGYDTYNLTLVRYYDGKRMSDEQNYFLGNPPDDYAFGYVIETPWGLILASYREGNKRWNFTTFKWGGDRLIYVGRYDFGPLPHVDGYERVAAAYNGTHLIEAGIDGANPSSFRLYKVNSDGTLTLVYEAQLTIANLEAPYWNDYIDNVGEKKIAWFRYAALKNKLVMLWVGSNSRTVQLLIYDMDRKSVWGGKVEVKSLSDYAPPGFILLNSTHMAIFKPQDFGVIRTQSYKYPPYGIYIVDYSKDPPEIVSFKKWPLAQYDLAPGYWVDEAYASYSHNMPDLPYAESTSIPWRSIYYNNRGWGESFGLYILREKRWIAITTKLGAEIFDYNFNPVGIVTPPSGRGVKQAHYINGKWYFLTYGDNSLYLEDSDVISPPPARQVSIKRPFYVAKENVINGIRTSPTGPPMLFYYDGPGYIVWYQSNPPSPYQITVDYTILINPSNIQPDEYWTYTLKIAYIFSGSGLFDLYVYAYNWNDSLFELIGIKKQLSVGSLYRNEFYLGSSHVKDGKALIRLEVKSIYQIYLGVDEIKLDAKYIAYNAYYNKFLPSMSQLKARDGNVLTYTSSFSLPVDIHGLPTEYAIRDISIYITVGARGGSYNLNFQAYNFNTSTWVTLNSTSLTNEYRIRVPLSSSYISSSGDVKLRIIGAASSGSPSCLIDEAVIEGVWITG